MPRPNISRRAVLSSTIAAAPALIMARGAQAQSPSGGGDPFEFEVTRTDSEWRALLSDMEYLVLREGATEVPKSDPLWESTEAGHYGCRGCDLDVYDARWKVVLDKGWLFFRHSEPNAVLTSIDRSLYERFRGPDAQTEGAVLPDADPLESLTPEEQEILADFIAIEVHCRRCGSHFGHIIRTDGKLLHCINGTSLTFAKEQA